MFKKKQSSLEVGKDIYLSSDYEVVKVKVIKVNDEYIFYERYETVPNRQMDIHYISNNSDYYFVSREDIVKYITEKQKRSIERSQEIINKALTPTN